MDHHENNCKPQKHLSNVFRHDKVKVNRVTGQTRGKHRSGTFVLTAFISFGLFNVFLLRASPPVLSMWDPAEIFFTSKFSYLLFCNPTHETETMTVNRWGTTNSKPPGPIIMIDQSKSGSIIQIIFITLSSRQVHKRKRKTMFMSQTGICWLLFIQF